MTTKRTLPAGMLASDLKYPPANDHPKDLPWNEHSFGLWFIDGFGWVIPTLAIRQRGQRTYGVAIGEGGTDRVPPKRGAQVRVGMGPHVLEQHTVHVRQSRLKALAPFLELMRGGQVDAHKTRDRISTRRMRRSLW